MYNIHNQKRESRTKKEGSAFTNCPFVFIVLCKSRTLTLSRGSINLLLASEMNTHEHGGNAFCSAQSVFSLLDVRDVMWSNEKPNQTKKQIQRFVKSLN